MLTRFAPCLLIGASLSLQASALGNRQLHASGMQVVRMLDENANALAGMPDICAGFEVMIDQIPNGRDSCTCSGSLVDCLFTPQCTDDQTDRTGCNDQVKYKISFEDKLIVSSCAKVEEGGFDETCTDVALGPDLMLEECRSSTYGEKPCECFVCDDRQSINIDCSLYDERAVTDCQAMGLGTPMAPGYENGSAPADPADVPTNKSETKPATTNIDTATKEESASGAQASQFATLSLLFAMASALSLV